MRGPRGRGRDGDGVFHWAREKGQARDVEAL